jgi:toxin FitB
MYLSVITIAEIRKGLAKLPESKRKDALSYWLTTLLEDYQDRIFPIDLMVAENWSHIQAKAEKDGRPMSSFDSLIAATGYTHNLVIVTRNVDDFEAGNVPVRNPWTES